MTLVRSQTHIQPLRSLLVVPFVSTIVLFGCSAVEPSTFNGDAGGRGGPGAGGSGAVSAGKSSASGAGEGGFNPAGSGGAGAGGDMGCATSSVEATPLPLNMFIAIDISGSMADPSDPHDMSSPSKWAVVQKAFGSFFTDPSAQDLRVALRFWPDSGCDAGLDPACAVAIPACMLPEVDVGPLSDSAHRMDLIAALGKHTPSGGTPTSAALAGATKWCANYIAHAHKAEKAVTLLVTDGQPTSCDINVSNIAHLADVAYQGAGVLTYAVGLAGSNPGTMNQIAAGGHTGQAFMIAPGNMAAQDLLAALRKIQGGAVACSFAMPAPPPGQTIDPSKVNVEYAPSGGGRVDVAEVSSAAACGPKGGFYYDNPASPTSINLCPATCTEVRGDAGAKVNIVLGCATHIG